MKPKSKNIAMQDAVIQELSKKPRVLLVDDFVSADECEHLISLGRGALANSKVMGKEGEDTLDDRRTSSQCWVQHNKTPTSLKIARKISKLIDIPLSNAESFQLVHYAESQEYQPHFDAFDFDGGTEEAALSRGGQRLTTALIYLNTVSAGGMTNFPVLDLEVAAKQGRVVLFDNCITGSDRRHPMSLHGGMPVEEGEKWAMNLWFREREFR